MMPVMMRAFALPALVGLACLHSAAAIAVPLDAPACEQLRQEMSALERSGARINLAKGADWARANLKPDQLQQVEKLIDSEAQFLFRCPQPKRQFDAATEKILESGTGSDPEPDVAKQPDVTKPAPPKKVARPKTAAPSASDRVAAPETPSDSAVTAPPPRPKRAAAKPKAADAFVPPAADAPQ
jgi:hypothetical protein